VGDGGGTAQRDNGRSMDEWMDGVVEEALLDADQVASNHRGILTRV
jgi:hypothetical protein